MQDNGILSSARQGKGHPRPRVLLGEEQGLLAGGNMGVDLGGGDGAVAQKGLDVADIHPRLQQGGGEGVAEHMGGDVAGGVHLG